MIFLLGKRNKERTTTTQYVSLSQRVQDTINGTIEYRNIEIERKKHVDITYTI